MPKKKENEEMKSKKNTETADVVPAKAPPVAETIKDGRVKTDFLDERRISLGTRRPFEEMRKEAENNNLPSIRKKHVNHAEPLSGARRTHSPLRRRKKPWQQHEKLPHGQTPNLKDKRTGRPRKMVPWYDQPHQADPVSYVLVWREMLEGDRKEPRLGERTLELHEMFNSLTSSPRCRQDYRHVVSVLRILYTEGIIDEIFIESVFAEHPILSHKKVTLKRDHKVVEDYIRDLTERPKQEWSQAAQKHYKTTVEKMKRAYIAKEKGKYPNLTDEDILQHWREPEKVLYHDKQDDRTVWVTKEQFLARYKAMRAERKAARLPILWRLHGRVPVMKRSKKTGEPVTFMETVDVEIGQKKNGGIWIGIPYYKGRGRRAIRISAYLKHYCQLPKLQKEPSQIDGQYIPPVHDRAVVRERPDSANAPDNADDFESLCENVGIVVNNGDKKTRHRKQKPQKKRMPKMRKPKAKRGKAGRQRLPEEEE